MVVRHMVGSSRDQGGQGVNAAAVGGKLQHLCPINHVADFTRVGLHSDGVGFHGNRLRRGAKFQLEVNARAIVFLQHEPYAFRYLESGNRGFHIVVADGNIGSHELPRIIRCEDSSAASFDVGNRYCDVGNHRTRRVGNSSKDGSVLSIGQERQAKHGQDPDRQVL